MRTGDELGSFVSTERNNEHATERSEQQVPEHWKSSTPKAKAAPQDGYTHAGPLEA